MRIRAYRPDDLESVLQVFFLAVHEGARHVYTPRQLNAWAPPEPDRARWTARLSGAGSFVCESDGTVVGFGRMTQDGLVDLLYVHPAWQRRGVASALLAHMLARSPARELRTLASLAARPFFEHHGFRVVAERKARRGDEGLRQFEMRLAR
ncbi:MAG: GNAT family N-acetyltransferase [Thiohalomonadaceae bacterium]